MSFPTLPGVLTASLTPLTAKGEPDLPALTAHMHWLLEQGSDGAALLGSTGEANSLTLEQRLQIIEQAGNSLPQERLMLGTGSCCLADAIRLTKASVDSGVNTVLVLPPFYYRPQSDEGVYRFFCELIEAVNEPKLRVVFYHFPQMSGYSFSFDVLLRLRKEYGLTAAGIKDSSGNWENMRGLAERIPDFSVYAGTEKFLYELLRAGGAGCITASGNLTSPACNRVYRAWNSGNMEAAESSQQELTAQRLALQDRPFVSGLKSLFALKSGRETWGTMLPPFIPLSDEDTRRFASEVESAGVELDLIG